MSRWEVFESHHQANTYFLNSQQDNTRVLQLLLAELPLKTAVKLAADITGAPRNELYDAALQLKKE